MSADAKLFDSLTESLSYIGAESGSHTLLTSERRGATHLLYDGSDRTDGVCNITVYSIDSKEEFINDLRDKLGEETFDVDDEEVHEAAWEVLERYKVAHFDEFC